MVDYCCQCSKKRPGKKTGEYTFRGKVYPIIICQWCRAANTRQRKRGINL